MTGMQWDERQYAELTKERELTPHEKYLLGRDTPAQYVEPRREVEPSPSAGEVATNIVVALAPPVVGIVAVGAFVWVVVSVAAMAVGAAMAFVSANAVYIGGGVFAVAAIALSLFGVKSSKPEGPPPGNSGEWEFYQEQRQGWRKKV